MSNTWGTFATEPFFRDPFGSDPFFSGFGLGFPRGTNMPLLTGGTDQPGGALTTRGQGWGDVFARGPRIDVIESEEKYVIKADLPGLRKEDVNVHLENDALVIEGERKDEREENDETKHIIERSFGRFRRQIRLPPDVKVDDVKANMDSGVLTLEIGKNPEAQQRKKRIELK